MGQGLALEAAKFRDHALSNNRLLVDWDAGFRNWLRKAAELSGKNDDVPGKLKLHMTAEEVKEWAGE